MRLVVTGGGTGGHIYPAVEVAREMARMLPSSTALYVGTREGMESRIVPREGLSFAAVRSSGVMGKSPLVAMKGLARALAGLGDALGILRSFRPDVVLGTGGYASGPVVLAASLLGIPRAIQEQNAVPGKTNQVLSRLSGRVFAAWDYSVRYFPKDARVIVTGNPVRADLFGASLKEARLLYGIPEDVPVILVLGGSRGAKTLAEAGLRIAPLLGDAWMILVAGADYFARTASAVAASPENGIDEARAGHIIIKAYEHNMPMAYAASDLVVCRAGGMTLSEVTALGKPAVVVPSPNVAQNHQEYNARALEEAGAAVVIREDASAAQRVCDETVRLLRDGERLARMAESSRRLGKPEAARQISRELLALARTGR